MKQKKNLICFVLQEEAKGKIYSTYTDIEDYEKKLTIQEYFSNISSDILKKCITDLCELFNLGLELKPKNIFYDEKEGFYFIDFLNPDNTPFDYNSVADFIRIKNNINQIFNLLKISEYSGADSKKVKKSKELYYKMMERVLLTLEELPNFKKFRRTILRTYSLDELNYLSNSGYLNEDLTLNEQEEKEFKENIDKIVQEAIEKIVSGVELWDIQVNEVRLSLSKVGLEDNWRYHKSNDIKIQDYESYWEYSDASLKSLIEKVLNLVYEKIDILALDTNNINILKAKNDLDKYRDKCASKENENNNK